jgi:hypothetical protein
MEYVREQPNNPNPQTSMVIACATVIEEMMPYMPANMNYKVLDFGLHNNPEALTGALQNEIDSIPAGIKTVLLGYGLCSQAVVGLRSDRFTLVIPQVDDCIAIFLGSKKKYNEQHQQVPGTYYLTKGWIEAGHSPMNEFEMLVDQHGAEKAHRIIGKMFNHYTRLALINTHKYDIATFRMRTSNMAEQFNLRYEEIQGSDDLIIKMFSGQWDDEFVVIEPGRTISFMDFRRDSTA